MRNGPFGRVLVLCALKVVAGTAIGLAILLNGVKLGGCPPGTFCLVSYEFYAMQLNLWSGFAMLFSLGLLLSALMDLFLIDLLTGVGPIELIERNIESIADID